jgi:predicted nucleotidyltransferase
VTPEVPTEVRAVADDLIAALGDDLAALLWHGSWARGEQTAESDHDMIVVLKRMGDDTCDRMQSVFEERPGWSVYVKTEEELRQYPITGRIQFHYGHLRLHGDFDPPPLTRAGLVEDMRRQAVDVAHEARYRLIHDGPGTLTGLDPTLAASRKTRLSRILYYQAKLAVLAMKARELHRGAAYPETRAELRARLTDPTELALIDVIDGWAEVKAGYEEDFRPLARLIDAFARGLVHELDAEAGE